MLICNIYYMKFGTGAPLPCCAAVFYDGIARF